MAHRLIKKRQTNIKGETKLLTSSAIEEIGEDFVVYKDPDGIYVYTIGDATATADIRRATRSDFDVIMVLL